MARPPDTRRAETTLVQATDYVLAHGLADLSLRPLAAALGTSTRMLLYDFGSKERLIAAILDTARDRQAAMLSAHLATNALSREDLVRAIWTWLTADELGPYLRLFFHVHVAAITRPDVYGDAGARMVTDWLASLGATPLRDLLDVPTATLVIATLRGLLLDRLTTHDVQRTDEAFETFARALGRGHLERRA